MSMGGGGSSSGLVIRAREAAQRAKAASVLGITAPARGFASIGNPTGVIAPAQPPTTGTVDRPNRDKTYGEVEDFLSGLSRMGKVPGGLGG